MANLGVNIDHVATLRMQRGTKYPDPIDAAVLAQIAGADQITVHLREDRRHIQAREVKILKEILQIPLNLEMANTPEMLDFAISIKPQLVTLVPEKREEKTTEGGLNVKDKFSDLQKTVHILQDNSIPVSLFIEPNIEDIELTAKMAAQMIEIHTGKYAEITEKFRYNNQMNFRQIITPESNSKLNYLENSLLIENEFKKIEKSTLHAHSLNLTVHAGHGLSYHNVKRIAQIQHIQDLNIGHSIISYAVLVGLERAIRDMKQLIV